MKITLTQKRLRLLFSSTALIFGALVLLVSLVSASQAVSYEGLFATQKKLYFNESLLPDHVLYPLVAAADRVVLVASSHKQKIKLHLTYSQIRMDYARALLDKDEQEMAVAALTKSQKYLNQAGTLLQENFDEELNEEIIKELENNIYLSKELVKKIDVRGTDLAIELNENNRLLLERLLRS